MKNKYIQKRMKRKKNFAKRKHIRSIPLEKRLEHLGVTFEQYWQRKSGL